MSARPRTSYRKSALYFVSYSGYYFGILPHNFVLEIFRTAKFRIGNFRTANFVSEKYTIFCKLFRLLLWNF